MDSAPCPFTAHSVLYSTKHTYRLYRQKEDTMSYASDRRDRFTDDMAQANAYYRESGDLAGYQERAREARESWQGDVARYYYDSAVNQAFLEACEQGGRIYVTLDTGEIVRIHTLAGLYAVSDTTGAPAEPIIARMVGGFDVKHTTLADLISRA